MVMRMMEGDRSRLQQRNKAIEQPSLKGWAGILRKSISKFLLKIYTLQPSNYTSSNLSQTDQQRCEKNSCTFFF